MNPLLAEHGSDWIVPDWRGPSHVRALFTTRNGGVSSGPAASMDIGSAHATVADLSGAIGENRRRLRGCLPSDPLWLSQVHGRDVARVVDAATADRFRSSPPQADAAVTRIPGVVLTVRTADCLPVLFADRAGSVVAVAHAGWRGLAAGVLEATVDAMDVAATQIVAWIGPCIGPGAFEVGSDVYDTYRTPDPGSAAHFKPLREGKWLADLPGLARRQLARLDIDDVAGGAWCTHRDAARFFSYRRDKRSGRMALVAWLEPKKVR